ncbi:MAG: hypothetical protein AAF149_06805 [Bacteroidota bacterium]
MDNLELIDAYLREEMDSSQKSSFEKKLASDPDLKGQFEFQSKIVAGIKEARKMELKAMLDQVAVGGFQSISLGKTAATFLVAGLVVWSIYYFNRAPEEQQFLPIAQESESAEDLIIENEVISEPATEKTEKESTVDQQADQLSTDTQRTGSANINEGEPVISEPKINKPELISDFEGDGSDADSLLAPGSVAVNGETKELSSIDVSVDNTKKKFTFHYQFKNGRLFLYGDFSSDLYEILEFNTDRKKALFLFYKGKFYDLDGKNERIVELKTVKNKALVAKLEEARTGN